MNRDKEELYAGKAALDIRNILTNRIDFDITLLQEVIRTMTPRYTCLRPPGAAGAAIVTRNGYIIYGDVRPADGSRTCQELGECMIEDGHCVRTIHAEVRAILNASQLGLCTQDATMYSILKPCFQCTKAIIAAGITKIVYAGAAYDEPRTSTIITNAPQYIDVIRLEMDLPYGQEV